MQLLMGVGGMGLAPHGVEGRARMLATGARVIAQRFPPTLHGAGAEARNTARVPHTRSGVPSLAAPVRPVRPVLLCGRLRARARNARTARSLPLYSGATLAL